VKNVNEIIAPKFIGKDPIKQKEIDKFLIKIDGTKNKSRLGANAVLGLSIAVCRAGAKAKNLPLYQYIARIAENRALGKLPLPCFNVINGGAHAKKGLDIQEFMVIPQFKYFSENLKAGIRIYRNLKKILRKSFKKIPIGDEGGFVPPLKKTEEVLDLLMKAIKLSGYSGKIKIGLDCAATQFFKNKKYKLEGKNLSKQELFNFYQNLIKKYPILFLEDPFSEEDWRGWQQLKSKPQNQKSKISIIGDDLLVTNYKRMKLAKRKNVCNGAVIKPNQIGTITETIEAVKLAKSFGWKIMVSHRSGETLDNFIADLAAGIGAEFIKSGAPFAKERMVKYNRLLRIEEEIRSGI